MQTMDCLEGPEPTPAVPNGQYMYFSLSLVVCFFKCDMGKWLLNLPLAFRPQKVLILAYTGNFLMKGPVV